METSASFETRSAPLLYSTIAAMNDLQSHRRILIDLLSAGFSDKQEDFGYAIDEHAKYFEDFIGSLGLSTCGSGGILIFFVYARTRGNQNDQDSSDSWFSRFS
jgi:hypothetical protein